MQYSKLLLRAVCWREASSLPVMTDSPFPPPVVNNGGSRRKAGPHIAALQSAIQREKDAVLQL